MQLQGSGILIVYVPQGTWSIHLEHLMNCISCQPCDVSPYILELILFVVHVAVFDIIYRKKKLLV